MRVIAVVTTSAAPIAVTVRLLAAVLSVIVVFLVLPFIFGLFDLLVLEMHIPVSLEVITDFIRVHRIRWIERIHLLVVGQPVLHGSRESIPNSL